MIETNVRIVEPGNSLSIPARLAKAEGSTQSMDLLELACLRLRRKCGLAATPHPENPGLLVVATKEAVPDVRLREEDWELTVSDAGSMSDLDFSSPFGIEVIPRIIERAILAKLDSANYRWPIKGSPRIWYEPKPVQVNRGISAYRRIAIASLFVEDEGAGIAVDTQTSFFTSETLDWFFGVGLTANEASRRRKLFDQLAEREQGHGTLVYCRGRTRTTCYFSEAPTGVTCDSTGPVRARGQTYPSVYDYYEKTCPDLNVGKGDRAVWVSFPNLKGAQPVAAKLLRLRVFNDSLPRVLQDLIIMSPAERRSAVFAFWKELGSAPLGELGIGFKQGLWCPPTSRTWRINPPELKFGNETILPPPASAQDYRGYYFDRIKMLREAGCYRFPPAAPRTLSGAYPSDVSEDSVRDLLADLKRAFNKWTGKVFNSQTLKYSRLDQAFSEIQNRRDIGMLLFVLDGDANGYYKVSLELGELRPKRLTKEALAKHYAALKDGIPDRRTNAISLQKGRFKWESFVGLIGLDLLQLQDGVPWAIPPGPFEAMLIIDVSHDRRYFGLSLLIIRPDGQFPAFQICTQIKPKVDSKEEAMNPEVLEEEVVTLFKHFWPARAMPLQSLLTIRDGRLCKQEPAAIEKLRNRLMELKILSQNARFEVVEFFKDSAKQFRVWEVANGQATNVIEGQAVEISREMVALVNTGRTTLTKGTAEPVLLHSPGKAGVVREAATSSFHACQLNWSNPRVAMRLPLPLNRTDEELIARSQQEARHAK